MKKFMVIFLINFILLISLTAMGQITIPNRWPKTSIQQSWVEPKQNCLVEVFSKFDLVQAPLTPDQVKELKRLNPNVIILPFDSMGEPRDKVPIIWDTGKNFSSTTAIQNVSDNCPIFHGSGGYEGVSFNGKNYQMWKAEVSANWKDKGYDGCYLDLWLNTMNDNPKMTPTEYKTGMDHLAERIRNLWPEGIHLVNSGGSLKHSFDLNGFMYEDFPNYIWPFTELIDTIHLWQKNGHKPTIIILSQRSYGQKKEVERDRAHSASYFWKRARFAVTLSMLWDETYVSFNSGSGGAPMWANPWFLDEFKVRIGRPVGDAYELAHWVFARKFTNGIIICNASGKPVTITASQLGGERYYRLKGGQVPNFNNGKLFDQVTLDGFPYQNDSSVPMGDGIILTKSPQTVVADMIIDDEGFDPNDWGTDQPTNINSTFVQQGLNYDGYKYPYWQDAWRVHGHDTCYFVAAGSKAAYGKWIPQIGIPGRYEIFEWHPTGDFATDAKFIISDGVKKDTVIVNQRINGGKWNSLGIYHLTRGSNNYIMVINNAHAMVVADAVKLVFKEPGSNVDDTPPLPPKNVRIN